MLTFGSLLFMKILLAAVNAKYIHTCPAIYSLRAYALANCRPCPEICLAEYTINDRYEDVLAGILGTKANVIAFSTYIWNISVIYRLSRDIRKVRGKQVQIWAGGPEASYTAADFLRKASADLVMLGEGEVTFSRLAQQAMLSAGKPDDRAGFDQIPGIAYFRSASCGSLFSQQNLKNRQIRSTKVHHPCFPDSGNDFLHSEASEKDFAADTSEEFIETGFAPPVDLSELPFLYQDLSAFTNRILYYESSRGCPFSCAYCLSGKEHGVRYRDLSLVRKELQFFLDRKVKQVKFVDRTFNADPERALAIWRYIKDHDNGITNFHFEIEADRMTPEEFRLLEGFRPGLIQMEIGVQSANPMTLKSVHRNTSLEAVERMMKILVPPQNINLHLDLIAGLPWEDRESFRHSFQKVYEMRPHQFQLGFLKLLPGTELYERREEYGLICSDTAPYEVLQTKWLSFEELALLHRISDRIEEFLNSQGFRRSLPLAESLFPDAFALFHALADYYREKGYETNRPSIQKRYLLFTEFILQAFEQHPELSEKDKKRILETIRLDQALHVHPSRKMKAELVLEPDGRPTRYQIDYLCCSPVNGEASFTETAEN